MIKFSMRYSLAAILADIFRQENKHEINMGIGFHCLNFAESEVQQQIGHMELIGLFYFGCHSHAKKEAEIIGWSQNAEE